MPYEPYWKIIDSKENDIHVFEDGFVYSFLLNENMGLYRKYVNKRLMDGYGIFNIDGKIITEPIIDIIYTATSGKYFSALSHGENVVITPEGEVVLISDFLKKAE